MAAAPRPLGEGGRGQGDGCEASLLLLVEASGDAGGRHRQPALDEMCGPCARRRAVALAGAVAAVGLLLLAVLGSAPAGARTAQAAEALAAGDGLELDGRAAEMRLQPLVARIQESFRPAASAGRGSFGGACHMTAHQRCPVAAMPRGNITAVFPGNGTRCILASSPAYLFQVIRGDADKLLIHFDMGGCCWDGVTLNLGLCLAQVSELGGEGIFDLGNPRNPFAEHTLVVVGYCSGDSHVGLVNRDWEVPGGGDVSQRGYWNTKSAVDWAAANFGRRRLRSLVVSGSSAGSLGAQIWARTILQGFEYEGAAVIADAFAGVFPAGVQGRVQQEAGLCSTGLLSERLQGLCDAGLLDVQSIWEDTMRDFPEVAFANIDGKIDDIQMAFYEAIHLTLLDSLDYTMTPQTFAAALAVVYRRYDAQPNWVSYAVNSANHMFLPKDVLYRARPGSTALPTSGWLAAAGAEAAGLALTGRDTPLARWLRRLPVQPGGSIRSECRGLVPRPAGGALSGLLGGFGALLGARLQPAAEVGEELTGLGRCDPGQAEKTFSRPAPFALG